MCKDPNVKVGIKDLNFDQFRGKMVVYLTDGRALIVPVSFFPDIKKMPLKDRRDWMVLDDQFFTFSNMSKVYSLADVMTLSR